MDDSQQIPASTPASAEQPGSGPSRTMVFWLRGEAVYCTLYNALLEKLSTTGDENIMEQVANFYVFDKL